MIYFRDQKNPRLEEATLRLLYYSLGVTSSVTSQLCIQSYFTMTLLYILLYTDSTFSNDDSKCQIQASEWIHNKLTFVENDRAPKVVLKSLTSHFVNDLIHQGHSRTHRRIRSKKTSNCVCEHVQGSVLVNPFSLRTKDSSMYL